MLLSIRIAWCWDYMVIDPTNRLESAAIMLFSWYHLILCSQPWESIWTTQEALQGSSLLRSQFKKKLGSNSRTFCEISGMIKAIWCTRTAWERCAQVSPWKLALWRDSHRRTTWLLQWILCPWLPVLSILLFETESQVNAWLACLNTVQHEKYFGMTVMWYVVKFTWPFQQATTMITHVKAE